MPKDTAFNVRAMHEFVVNLVDEAIAEKMNLCAASLPFGENELIRAGLTSAPSCIVKPPRIVESPASLECVESGTLQIGGNSMVIGLIKRLHVSDELFDVDKKRIHTENFCPSAAWRRPIGIAALRERFEMIRPK